MRHSDYGDSLEPSDLAPCRACGCAPEVRGDDTDLRSGFGVTWIKCPKCGISTKHSTNGQGVANDWNRVMGGPTTIKRDGDDAR